ncbi:MAG: hydroxymethylbilane synthase [Planctomycetota bacterium]
MKLRVGTRGSDLAMWQAHRTQGLLAGLGHEAELVIVETSGDRIQDVPLTADLGRSFFTKEIEDALLREDIDLAVHSLKDLAVDMPPGLHLGAVPERADPRERLLLRPGAADPTRPLGLVEGARVGTSSPRRRRRLAELRPDLELLELRGNVPTRLAKLRRGDYDAILLACAGLDRLGLDVDGLEVVELGPEVLPGAPGQGALGLQCRAADAGVRAALAALDDDWAARTTAVERGLLKALGGGCSLPLGAFCDAADGELRLRAFLYPEAGPALEVDLRGDDPEALVERAAALLRPALDRPLQGRRVLLLGGPRPPRLARDLEAAGADVAFATCFGVEALPVEADLAGCDHVLCASTTTLEVLRRAVDDGRVALDAAATLVVPGQATARAARELFPDRAVVVGDPPRSLGLGRAALARGARSVAALGAEGGSADGAEACAAAGVATRSLALYRTVPEAPRALPADPDAVLWLAPAAVRAVTPATLAGGPRLLAMGPSTARELEAAGVDAAVAVSPDLPGLLTILSPGA